MGNRKEEHKSIYYDSLSRIFVWSGFDMFVIMLIACVVIGMIVFFYNRLDSEGIKLMVFCLAMVVPCSYGLPMLSLFNVWRQERILGIYWKDRTDYNRPVQERDWYLACNRGGFLLYHRAYIQRILNAQVVEETTDLGRANVYCVKFEDIRGKTHTVKFSSSGEQKQFQQWYNKQAWIEENDEVD